MALLRSSPEDIALLLSLRLKPRPALHRSHALRTTQSFSPVVWCSEIKLLPPENHNHFSEMSSWKSWAWEEVSLNPCPSPGSGAAVTLSVGRPLPELQLHGSLPAQSRVPLSAPLPLLCPGTSVCSEMSKETPNYFIYLTKLRYHLLYSERHCIKQFTNVTYSNRRTILLGTIITLALQMRHKEFK